MPLDSDGLPYFRYAAGYINSSQKTSVAYLQNAYTLSTFSTTVTRTTNSYISTSYIDANTWAHGGGSSDTIIGTLVFYGDYYDFELDIPWIGYKTTTITAYDGNNSEITFTIRTGPSNLSIKASEGEYSFTKFNAFAFRLKD